MTAARHQGAAPQPGKDRQMPLTPPPMGKKAGLREPEIIAAYEAAGICCIPVPVEELQKANGAVGCMTGILHRKM
ncbi:MAG TPA: hypothetical protein VJ959_00380 [Desulfotignum sp.]|nr:hypothetical protein [Desulfotignum sp.]